MMICAMKVISVGFDMDAAATEEECTTTDKTGGRGEARGRTVRKTVKSSGGSNNGVTKGVGGDEGLREGTEPDSAAVVDELAVMPGWFEFAGKVE